MSGVYIPDYLVGTGQAIPVPNHGDLVDRAALLSKVTAVSTQEWVGSHFEPKIIRVIPEEVLLEAPVVLLADKEVKCDNPQD